MTNDKRLRLHTRFGRELLGRRCTCAWTCIQAEVRRLLGRDDVLPGMVAAIQWGTRSRVAANSCTGTRTSTHAVIGGNAIAAWVARVDVEAVRNTKDVDILVRREDFERVIKAAQAVGFVYQNVAGIDLFLDGPEGSVRSAVRVVFAREKVRAEYLLPAPDVTESEAGPEFTVAALDDLVRMKLTSFRLKDKVHLLDLLDVGLIDETWCDRFPPALGARLRELLEARDREL
jgi:hypothetical protein